MSETNIITINYHLEMSHGVGVWIAVMTGMLMIGIIMTFVHRVVEGTNK